jgi:glycerol uptake facilitator-like aquaporin
LAFREKDDNTRRHAVCIASDQEEQSTTPKLAAEFPGAFWLALGGCGRLCVRPLRRALPRQVWLRRRRGHRSRDDLHVPDRDPGRNAQARITGFAGIAIGLCLTLIHLISIPVTNTSVNPARSTGPALFVGGWATEQLWLFWVAPIVGAVAAGGISRAVFDSRD